jgi:hypothetical protein
MRTALVGAAALAGLLTGCAQDDFMRTEGLTLAAGDAVAANSALQIIDPWPAGVEDTTLNPPADRGDTAAAKDAQAAPGTTGGQP